MCGHDDRSSRVYSWQLYDIFFYVPKNDLVNSDGVDFFQVHAITDLDYAADLPEHLIGVSKRQNAPQESVFGFEVESYWAPKMGTTHRTKGYISDRHAR